MRAIMTFWREPSSKAGFTLLELVIAILVLSIGTLAITRTLDQSRRQIGEAPVRHLAQTVAQNRGEEIRVLGVALGRGLPDQVKQGSYDWQIATESKKTDAGIYEVTVTVSGDDQPGALLVVYTTWGPSS